MKARNDIFTLLILLKKNILLKKEVEIEGKFHNKNNDFNDFI